MAEAQPDVYPLVTMVTIVQQSVYPPKTIVHTSSRRGAYCGWVMNRARYLRIGNSSSSFLPERATDRPSLRASSCNRL